MPNLAFFVTPHGFGHAARASAVMDALSRFPEPCRFEIFTEAPRWFFDDSVSSPFGYHKVLTDIGFVQNTPFQEDVRKTLRHLESFFPLEASSVDRLAEKVTGLGCCLVVCDISPLGIAVGKKAGIPSVLVENFTWDWIYSAYVDVDRRLAYYVDYLRDLFSAADFHVQTMPVCSRAPDADLLAGPASRRPSTSVEAVRNSLGIRRDCKMVLVTCGGVETHYAGSKKLEQVKNVHFVIPAGAGERESAANVSWIPQRGRISHPDLIFASDAVIGKAGYSTLAEVYAAGVPFGYIPRKIFPESVVLAEFIDREMPSLRIGEDEFFDGSWTRHLQTLLSLKKQAAEENGKPRDNGADTIAVFLENKIASILQKNISEIVAFMAQHFG